MTSEKRLFLELVKKCNQPLLIIGITYEGSPGSKENESTLFGMNNAVVSGYTLTPKIFEQWLSDAGFIDFK